MAWVGLEDAPFHAHHGVHPHERRFGGGYRLSVWWRLADNALAQAAQDDALAETVDYGAVYDLMRAHMAQPANLIETVAERLAADLLARFPAMTAVRLKLEKQTPPLGAPCPRAVIRLSKRRPA